MNRHRWAKFIFFLGLMVSLLTPSRALDQIPPDSMPTSGVCTSLPAETTAATRTFYVALTGGCSITESGRPGVHSTVSRSVKAGTQFYNPGGVSNASVDIQVSGSATAGPVTFQSYPGETAILDGTGLTPPADNIRGLINIENQSYVIVRGLEVRNYQATNAAAAPTGIWVAGGGSHIQILGNHVHDIGTAEEASGNALGIAV